MAKFRRARTLVAGSNAGEMKIVIIDQRFISKKIQDRAIPTVERQKKLVNFNDLE